MKQNIQKIPQKKGKPSEYCDQQDIYEDEG